MNLLGSVTTLLAFLAGIALMALFLRGRLGVAQREGQRLSEQQENWEHRLQQSDALVQQGRQEERQWRIDEARLKAEKEALVQQRSALHIALTSSQQTLQQREAELLKNTVLAAELQTRLEAEQRSAQEKLDLLVGARQELSLQFKQLAGEVLEEKSRHVQQQHETSLGQLLTPLRERLTEFGTKVDDIHRHDTEQQAQLKAELGQLKTINQRMTEEAHQLATALKGQAKVQGNWGELVLENLLDRCGLREGQDYRREVSFETTEGRRRPDVIIYLPQAKHLVIDAKVSLNAYTRYVNATEEGERRLALKEHGDAVAARISELSDRSYFTLPGLNTPEMVFLFIPVESAFVEALRADDTLFQQALEKNVLVATPTTLLTSLNIVRQLWRFEEQNAHTAQLAESATRFYKKLVGFIGSMDQMGKDLERARTSYDKAYTQLVSGKGNLIRQAHQFEQLGVSIQTRLPEDLVARAELELDIGGETL